MKVLITNIVNLSERNHFLFYQTIRKKIIILGAGISGIGAGYF